MDDAPIHDSGLARIYFLDRQAGILEKKGVSVMFGVLGITVLRLNKNKMQCKTQKRVLLPIKAHTS